jgi:hypothetical protein
MILLTGGFLSSMSVVGGFMADLWGEIKRDGVRLFVLLIILLVVFLVLTVIRACSAVFK